MSEPSREEVEGIKSRHKYVEEGATSDEKLKRAADMAYLSHLDRAALLALAFDKNTGEAYIERAAISEELRKEALARVAVLESALIDAQTYIDECLADDSGSVLETVHAALHPKGQ